jgi:glycosyltransferase involved in cell wall biosynthesis
VNAVRRTLRLAIGCDSSVLGGTERVTANLLTALSREVEVTIIGCDAAVVEWLAKTRPGTDVVLVPPIRSKRCLGAMWARRRAIRKVRPDVYHANLTSVYSGGVTLFAATSVHGVAAVAVEHLPIFVGATPLRRRLKRFVSGRLAAHVAVGDAAARAIERDVGLPPESIRTIHNGVPELELDPVLRMATGPVVGTLARLDIGKGLDVLVAALAKLPDVVAVVVGAGPEEVRLRDLARRTGVSDRFEMVGWRERPRDFLPTFDVFVLPSRAEGLPLSIIEAMLAERAVVATRVGSVAEVVVDGETGLLVPPDEPAALAEAIASVLGDDERRQAMGRAGRELARRAFSVEVMARGYEQLYADITGLPVGDLEPR